MEKQQRAELLAKLDSDIAKELTFKQNKMIHTKDELLKQWRSQYEERFGKITTSELLEGVDTAYAPEIQIRISDSEILEQLAIIAFKEGKLENPFVL
jgi:predicted transcriptional regulator